MVREVKALRFITRDGADSHQIGKGFFANGVRFRVEGCERPWSDLGWLADIAMQPIAATTRGAKVNYQGMT